MIQERNIERAIEMAATDIADSMVGGEAPARRRAVQEFLMMALWSSAAAAEALPSSAWIDPKKDDGWLRSAAERYELPKLTDSQFRQMAELLGFNEDAIAKSLPTRIKLEPEMQKQVESIVGLAPAAPEMPEKPAPLPELPELPPSLAPESPEKHAPAEPAPKREQEIPRQNVKAPEDEFAKSIADNPGLPGAPRPK